MKKATFEQITAQLVKVMGNAEEYKEYMTDGHVSTCFGWDGNTLSPVSRGAFVAVYGEETMERAEREARSLISSNGEEYAQSRHHAAMIEAERAAQTNEAPKAGAFVLAIHSGLKCDDGQGIYGEIETAATYCADHMEERRPDLCKVVKVYEVSSAEFDIPGLSDKLVSTARESGEDFPGGAEIATEDENRRDLFDNYKYYYTLTAAVVCRESGRWFLINSEGYSYARYCLMPINWREMYAGEVAEAERKQAEREEQERQEEERKAAERLAEYRAKCAKYEAAGLEDLTPYREAADTARREESETGRAHGYRSAEYKAAEKITRAAVSALMAAEKRNIKKMAETAYHGIKCKVTKADRWKNSGFTLTYEDGPMLEEFEKNTDFDLFAAYWEEYRMDDCAELHRYDLTEFADKYGDGHGVEIVREMSKAERERITAAILQAVPAAAGICWERRHEWTQAEIQAAAAAVGVDGWELWKVYDNNHSYFNFVSAGSLAEWAHGLISYELTTPAPEPQPSKATEKVAEDDDVPAEGLQLVEIADGVAVVADDWKTTYYNKRHIKAHGCKWNKEAKRWEATEPQDVVRVRAWFSLRNGSQPEEKQADTCTRIHFAPEDCEGIGDAA